MTIITIAAAGIATVLLAVQLKGLKGEYAAYMVMAAGFFIFFYGTGKLRAILDAPEQIQGYGLGVMNARAAYYAKRDERFKQFLTEGRSFGPHGQDLVVADSIEHYNDELSKELTQLTVTANLHMRAIGFKPFIAPAYSSGAISLILTLRGEWHCGSVFLGGIFMGVKNRYTSHGLETEILPLPDALYERIVTAQENLKAVN